MLCVFFYNKSKYICTKKTTHTHQNNLFISARGWRHITYVQSYCVCNYVIFNLTHIHNVFTLLPRPHDDRFSWPVVCAAAPPSPSPCSIIPSHFARRHFRTLPFLWTVSFPWIPGAGVMRAFRRHSLTCSWSACATFCSLCILGVPRVRSQRWSLLRGLCFSLISSLFIMTIASLCSFWRARALKTKNVDLLKEHGNLERKTVLRLSVGREWGISP